MRKANNRMIGEKGVDNNEALWDRVRRFASI